MILIVKTTSRSVPSFALLAAALLPATFAFAISRPVGCPEGYVYLETGDANSGSTGIGFDHSSLTVESTTGHWSDHLPPSSDKDYYVASLQLATPNNNNVAAETETREWVAERRSRIGRAFPLVSISSFKSLV